MSDTPPDRVVTLGQPEAGAWVEVTIAADGLLARGVFHPSSVEGGHLLVFPELVEGLNEAGITTGLQDRQIQEAIFRCNMDKVETTAIVARGTPALKERPAFLKLENHIYAHHFERPTGIQVDFKEYTPFVIVKKGELLARAVLPQEGREGVTVTGDVLPSGRKDVKLLKPGPHTLFAHGKVFARLAGRFVLENDVFDVSDQLEIAGGVDYSTGNVVFPGSIVVKGVVQDGFKLVAGGAITVTETLDASEVLCKGDLTAAGGIIGKKPGLVRVGGSVKALFVENCQMDVLGSAHFAKSILHTRLCVNGDLSLDDGGRIVSSSITVRGTLSCTQLGNENGPCHVIAGTDFVVLRKMEGIRSSYKELEDELHRLRGRHQELGAARALELEADLKARLENLVNEMNHLTPSLFLADHALVRVTGTVHAGTVIEMGFARLQIDEKTKGKTFRPSPDRKSIIAEAV